MSESGFAHNADLPGGRMPYWIKDDALVEIGLVPGDAVAVEFASDPVDGDLVLVEVELADDSDKMARYYFERSDLILLKAANTAIPDLHVAPERAIVLGVIKSRIRFEPVGTGGTRIVEEPLA
jgi:SOS-response transcriptional repressor LexA